ncbi:MAG: transcriptional repressor LexA [Sedimentisphaerales bacterium]
MGQKTDVPPTPRQVQLLRAIAEFAGRDGYSPTIGELAQIAGVSRTTTFEHIEQLRKKGYIWGLAGKARSLTPTSKARKLLNQLNRHQSQTKETAEIPLAGVVAAGMPIEAVENKDNLLINSLFGSCDDVFALAVRGDSMKGENINHGDYVICRRASSASDGQLVVAIVDNENATLKRFYKEPGRVRLQPANDQYQPIYSDNCRVEGVVIGLIRKL